MGSPSILPKTLGERVVCHLQLRNLQEHGAERAVTSLEGAGGQGALEEAISRITC